jgi:hypothetical protein
MTKLNRSRGNVGRRLTALLRVAPVLFLAACGPSSEQEDDMAQCRGKALKTVAAVGPEGIERSCMLSKGYHFYAALKDCGDVEPYANAACYSR